MALVQDADGLTAELAHQTLALLRVDALGLDESDRRYLRVLSEQYHGGPVGPRSLAASAGLDLGTIESAIEPWLLRSQLIVRTRHGRQLTPAGLRHLATGMESVV
jgi:Holliday junction DNA helicase RuvB